MSAGDIEAVRFPVEGMTCQSCVGRITRRLRPADGVHGPSIDLRAERVSIRRSMGTAPDADLAAAIADAGYMADLTAAVAVPPERTRLERLPLPGGTELLVRAPTNGRNPRRRGRDGGASEMIVASRTRSRGP